MSFDRLLIHRLVRVREVDDGPLGEDGHPTVTGTETLAFRGRVYSKSAQEVADSTVGGAGVSDHIIRCRPIDIVGADYIVYADPDDPTQPDSTDTRRYEVDAVHVRNARRGPHHLSLEARLVTWTPGGVVAPGS